MPKWLREIYTAAKKEDIKRRGKVLPKLPHTWLHAILLTTTLFWWRRNCFFDGATIRRSNIARMSTFSLIGNCLGSGISTYILRANIEVVVYTCFSRLPIMHNYSSIDFFNQSYTAEEKLHICLGWRQQQVVLEYARKQSYNKIETYDVGEGWDLRGTISMRRLSLNVASEFNYLLFFSDSWKQCEEKHPTRVTIRLRRATPKRDYTDILLLNPTHLDHNLYYTLLTIQFRLPESRNIQFNQIHHNHNWNYKLLITRLPECIKKYYTLPTPTNPLTHAIKESDFFLAFSTRVVCSYHNFIFFPSWGALYSAATASTTFGSRPCE